MSGPKGLLRTDQLPVVAGLLALSALAWWYVWQGAGMGMTAPQMTRAVLFPHLTPEPMPGMVMPAIAWTTALLMWWVMMVAMMTPSATPLVLLYRRVLAHAAGGTPARSLAAPSLALICGYLLAWLGFSLLATAALYWLAREGLISKMMLWSQSATLSALVLAAAGLYQFTPLHNACLAQCRAPAQFLTQHMRTGVLGALRLGLAHGAWCVGCCWLLMSLLFVFGVMNLVWIALLSILVLAERLSTRGVLLSRIVGALLLAWSLLTLFA